MALANATFAEILDDLSSRFIINVPEEELASVERICFQIEQAHWFYEDFHCPLLHQWSHEHEKAFADFMQYKIRVPVCGAIMLNDTMEKCVLVKGWSSRSGWGFPKGKINKDEPDSTCAAREVLEETGYDISPLIKEQDYVELTIREQRIRLYIVVGVSEDTEFCPKTRKEISKIEWHKVADLPTWIKSRDRDTPYHCGGGCVKYGSSRFYMVVPFVSKLRNWLRMQRKIARKKAAETSNQEESTEVVIFNGHATTSNVKETSPETSVPGTDSEGSAHEQSPNIGAQLSQFSPQTIDSQNILNSILCVNRPTSTQPTNNSIEESSQFKQNHSYFSTGPIIDQSPQTTLVQMKNPVINDYSANLLPQLGSLQISNTVFSEERNSPKNYLKGISRSNSQTPIQNNNNRDITAPIPIHARQNSLLSLFAASTSARPSSSTSLPSTSVEYDTQRRNSLLNVLQPETSIITPSKNLTHDDIVQHQLQQFKVQSDSYDTIKSLNDHVKNDSVLIVTMQKMSSNIGHIGQGRPSNNSDNNSEICEVARKMSLLGLFSTASNSGDGLPIVDISSVDAPINIRTNYQTPGTLLHTNITNSSTKTTLSQGYGRTINESDNSIGKVSPDFHVRHELLNRIHAFIPPGGTKLFHDQSADKNPMTSFKFDIEKIVAAL
ncbi:hypothetical protein RhiirA4_407311 [Rhizophagus irregularis]|uniref:Nudix hydrolase domain-containing protein n=1 Tax=Rhizophagus irregularis TaxID=588596 RepID=A0A2I1GXC3_9GLOM|nr:hypothetical protein RhiirA4_407311 [Rhizophagus irregularis]